ncbi:MAG: HAMP domain-containing sensor histidine kinase [Fulvivirga sp.]
MNKRTTWFIIGLMSIALIGLTSFQVYWVNNAIKLNKQRFKENVFESLNYVVNNLENREVIHIAENDFYFFSTDSANAHMEVRRPPIPGRAVIIQDGKTITTHTDGKGDYQFEVIADDTIRFIRKRQAVNIVVDKLIRDKKSIEHRVNQNIVDSLLQRSLHQQGIDINYQFAIWNADKDKVIFSNSHFDKEEIANTELKASLFPNDIMDNMNYLVINFPTQDSFLFKEIWLTLLTSVLFILTIIGCFGYAIHIIFKQKRLSEIKNDFINNMTHELKTPLATVSLACQALTENEVRQNSDQLARYVSIINEENVRLTGQVEMVLNAAQIDKQHHKLNIGPVNLKEVLQDVIDKHKLRVEKSHGVVTTDLAAADILLSIDQEHMSNVFNNLIDNAIKYSKETPEIDVTTKNIGSELLISITDKGIGMKPREIDYIFDKFYRVPTGNRHDVKGFGLGLSYVKSVVEKHGGQVSVTSAHGEGSTFTVKLPLV